MIKTELSRKYLQKEYEEGLRSAYSIAKSIGCSTKYVLKKIRKFGFEVRSINYYYKNRGSLPKRQKYRHVLTREFLEEEYNRNLRNMRSIAKETGTNEVTVANYLKRHGFKIRSDHFNPKTRVVREKLTRSYLEEEYGANRRSAASIAEEFGVHHFVVVKRLREFGFEVRPNGSYDTSGNFGEYAERKYDDVLTHDYLEEEYIKKQRSGLDIAEEMGVSHWSVLEYLRRHGIPVRERGSFANGEDHPNWQGGKSFEPYGMDFDEELKECVRERDGHTCRICSSSGFDYKLHVHHIDYEKTNNVEGNMVSLCKSCHTKTNFNRDAWIAYFQKLLENVVRVAV